MLLWRFETTLGNSVECMWWLLCSTWHYDRICVKWSYFGFSRVRQWATVTCAPRLTPHSPFSSSLVHLRTLVFTLNMKQALRKLDYPHKVSLDIWQLTGQMWLKISALISTMESTWLDCSFLKIDPDIPTEPMLPEDGINDICKAFFYIKGYILGINYVYIGHFSAIVLLFIFVTNYNINFYLPALYSFFINFCKFPHRGINKDLLLLLRSDQFTTSCLKQRLCNSDSIFKPFTCWVRIKSLRSFLIEFLHETKVPQWVSPLCFHPSLSSRGHHRVPRLCGDQPDQRGGQHAEDIGPDPHHHHRHVRAGRLPGRHLRGGAVLRLLARRHVGEELVSSGEL